MIRNILLSFATIALLVFTFSGSKVAKSKVNLAHYKIQETTYNYHVPNKAEAIATEAPIQGQVFSLYLGKTYVGFKEALGFKESRGSYTVINQYGYLGKYQFAASTLTIIGVYSPNTFINDSKLQEKAFLAHTSRNKWILRRDIKRYVGKTIGGIKVTESGILAAAHLAGAGNVKKYLRSGGTIGFQDAFGTSIRYYLKRFSGYDTSLVKPNKKARVI
ncbi:peptidoglycan-binding protein LysM [Patiriisocius sp. Uisw_017]|jgi:hypothetical protein|uniref:peptidoglycan-binding protein LysM n=1 Tax=Patiriisocius sp. Uisw_017 TaxID=3230968 RepID=UPI0039EC5C82